MSSPIPPQRADPAPTDVDHAFDIVVVGSGIGGLSAAIYAIGLGLSVVVLEWSDKIGGSTARSFGGAWVACNDIARDRGLHDHPSLAARYMEHVCGGQGEPSRVSAFLGAAPRALNLLLQAGVALELNSVGDHFHGSAAGSLPQGRSFEVSPFVGSRLGEWRERLLTKDGDAWRLPMVELLAAGPVRAAELLAAAGSEDKISQGAGLVAHALKAAIDGGARILTDVRATTLVRDGKRVTGVRAAQGGIFTGRLGVVIATGGFEADTALSEMVEGLPGYRSVYLPTVVGDGLRLASQVGGALKVIHNSLAIFMAYEDPSKPEPQVAANWEMTRPHGMVVNAAGHRFGNEGSFQDLASTIRLFDGRTRRHSNLPCWLVFDQQFVDRWGFAGGFGTVPDWVPRADSLAALATRVGLDGDQLGRSVDRFNGFAATGIDDDFGRGNQIWALAKPEGDGPNPSLGTINAAPFYAVQLFPTIIGASGLRADDHARVLDWANQPIEGLFAVGNAAAHDEYGVGYQAGQSVASAFTFALLAVETMAAGGGRAADAVASLQAVS